MKNKHLFLALAVLAVILSFAWFLGGNVISEAARNQGEQDRSAVRERDTGEAVFPMTGKGSRVSRFAAASRSEATVAGVVAEVALKEMQRRDGRGLEMVTLPDGHQSIHLQGRFQHVCSFHITEDGSHVIGCGDYSHVFDGGQKTQQVHER